jgi:hypothetical protein
MAMMKAKKSYKKMGSSSGKTSKKRGGSVMQALNPAPVDGNNTFNLNNTPGNVTLLGGKKSKKSKKSRKGSKKSDMGDM